LITLYAVAAAGIAALAFFFAAEESSDPETWREMGGVFLMIFLGAAVA
jgi:hypothetical protein